MAPPFPFRPCTIPSSISNLKDFPSYLRSVPQRPCISARPCNIISSMIAAIYMRISPNPNKDDTDNQERDLVEFARANKWEIRFRYRDIYVSGSRKGKDRPQFKEMMEDARKRKFDLLLFWSLDRLTREGTSATLSYLNQLTSYGVEYKSYTEQYLDSCGIFKDVVVSIMATIANQERVRLIERTKAGLQTARDRGVKLGPKFKVIDSVKAREMRDGGMTLKAIGEKVGVSEATICRLLSKGRVRHESSGKSLVIDSGLTGL